MGWGGKRGPARIAGWLLWVPPLIRKGPPARGGRRAPAGGAPAERDYSSRMAPPPLFTAGHSTRPVEELIALLAEHGVRLLVDVRRFPGSRRHPQFSRDALAGSLAAAGIDYLHEPDLGW